MPLPMFPELHAHLRAADLPDDDGGLYDFPEPDPRFISADDLPIGAEEDDFLDMTVMLDCFANGRDF